MTKWALALSLATTLFAQDADTILLKADARKFTLLSQIADPKEAAAFAALLPTTDPAQRHTLATAFLNAYPKSWLLAQAYDAAARSAIDLSQPDEALEHARLSLRLLPENPSLLVLLANLESQQNQFAPAIRHATDALEYLDQIESQTLQPQLKASAYFARARAETTPALAANPHRSDKLALALNDLNRAAAWNPEDPEIFYLRAILALQLNKTQDAIPDLAFVAASNHALKNKAEKILLLLSKNNRTAIPPREINATLRSENSQPVAPKILSAGYAGPASCKPCHTAEYNAWRQTGMAKMLQPYRPASIVGDFSVGTKYEETSGAIRMGIAGRPYFEVQGPAAWERFYVDYTIGSKWQQDYATKLPDGRLQVLPIEYNLLRKKWINYWKIIDPPNSPRAVIRDFPKLTAATNYQQNCAICHTSQLKSDAASPDPLQHATYLQPGIDCEMCHGPSALHARRPANPPFDFRRASNRDGVRVCAQCHRQSAVREIGEAGEMNYSTQINFVPPSKLRSYDAFSRQAFYKDGRFRETTFLVEAFTRSACYRQGIAQCATCHSPHLPDFEHNQTSLKYPKTPNEMCLSCHSQYRSRIAQHTRHQAGTEASQCVACHMPKIVNALLFKARSHQIEIPTADLTARFGQEESPNACLLCHNGKSAQWAQEQLTQWSR